MMCRFWHGQHSRQRLPVQKEIAYALLTYWQIDAFFLNFLFLFGQRLTRKDSYFSSFRCKYTAADRSSPDLDAAYVSADFCYNLQGVERHKTANMSQWSIRHTVIYHRLDFSTGSCTWLIVKGNDEVNRRIRATLQSTTLASQHPRDALCEAALINEELACWSVENWRWYLDSLDEVLDEISRSCLDHDVVGIPFASKTKTETPAVVSWKDKSPFVKNAVKWGEKLRQSMSPTSATLPQPSIPPATVILMKPPPPEPEPPTFTFEQLQNTINIEEEINSALLALEGNLRVLTAIRTHYADMPKNGKIPTAFGTPAQIQNRLSNFLGKLEEFERDMSMHRARCQSLLRLVEERKQLVSGAVTKTAPQTDQAIACECTRIYKHGDKQKRGPPYRRAHA